MIKEVAHKISISNELCLKGVTFARPNFEASRYDLFIIVFANKYNIRV